MIKLENVFDTNESVCLVLEYVGGGELSKRISRIKKMSEEEAKVIFYQLVLAVQYMHKNEIVHRDLKVRIHKLDKIINPSTWQILVWNTTLLIIAVLFEGVLVNLQIFIL